MHANNMYFFSSFPSPPLSVINSIYVSSCTLQNDNFNHSMSHVDVAEKSGTWSGEHNSSTLRIGLWLIDVWVHILSFSQTGSHLHFIDAREEHISFLCYSFHWFHSLLLPGKMSEKSFCFPLHKLTGAAWWQLLVRQNRGGDNRCPRKTFVLIWFPQISCWTYKIKNNCT